jgi:hypothetical protein
VVESANAAETNHNMQRKRFRFYRSTLDIVHAALQTRNGLSRRGESLQRGFEVLECADAVDWERQPEVAAVAGAHGWILRPAISDFLS